MPVAPRSRQAGVADWFATETAQQVEAVQSEAVTARVASLQRWPLLWLAPTAGWPLQRPDGNRLYCLHWSDEGRWGGDWLCRLPFPLASESIGAVVMQLPPLEVAEALLAECHRVLVPGGVLWLLTGQPGHPARWLHPGHRVWQSPSGGWRHKLEARGLRVRDIQRLGPVGIGVASACQLLEAEKRTTAPVGPRPVRKLMPQLARQVLDQKVT